MKATGKVDTKTMNQLDEIFFKCLMKSIADMRTDVVKSLTMPLLTGELQESTQPAEQPEISSDDMYVWRLVTEATYSEGLYNRNDLHQTIETHLDNDLCLAKAEKYGGVRANPFASGHWFDTYLDGDKSDFAKEKFSEHLRKELSK